MLIGEKSSILRSRIIGQIREKVWQIGVGTCGQVDMVRIPGIREVGQITNTFVGKAQMRSFLDKVRYVSTRATNVGSLDKKHLSHPRKCCKRKGGVFT